MTLFRDGTTMREFLINLIEDELLVFRFPSHLFEWNLSAFIHDDLEQLFPFLFSSDDTG